MKRFTVLLLPVALAVLAGCQVRDLPTGIAPEAPSFDHDGEETLVVNSRVDAIENYECEEPGTPCSLRAAIQFAHAPATIVIAVEGTISLTQGELIIAKDLVITGPGAASLTLSGNDASRVLRITSGTTASLSGLTIAHGNSSEQGGGIYNEGNLTLRNTTVSRNRATGGGGAILNGGTLTLDHSTVSGNAARTGGGIENQGEASSTLEHSTVSGNRASFGGGGVYNAGSLALLSSTVSGNRADSGGGIANVFMSNAQVENSTISGNEAEEHGGGIYNDGNLTLKHSSVADNSAEVGGGFYNVSATLTLQSSILANSPSAGDCTRSEVYEGSVIDNGYNVVQDGSCLTAATSRSGDPLLGPLADNGGPTLTHALLVGSRAIDAIPSAEGCLFSADQRGFPRPSPSGGNCDIGALEVQPPTLTLGIDGEGTIVRKQGAATLSGTLTCAAPVAVTLNVSLSQSQAKGRKTTTVTGRGSTSVSCSGSTLWTVTVTPTSGKFAAGAASATASAPGAAPVTETVLLR